MAEVVYVLCAITSMACSVLLFRGYRATGGRLLFWAGTCFGGLALNNILLFIDLVVVPTVDLGLARSGIALIAMMILIIGLIWETR